MESLLPRSQQVAGLLPSEDRADTNGAKFPSASQGWRFVIHEIGIARTARSFRGQSRPRHSFGGAQRPPSAAEADSGIASRDGLIQTPPRTMLKGRTTRVRALETQGRLVGDG